MRARSELCSVEGLRAWSRERPRLTLYIDESYRPDLSRDRFVLGGFVHGTELRLRRVRHHLSEVPGRAAVCRLLEQRDASPLLLLIEGTGAADSYGEVVFRAVLFLTRFLLRPHPDGSEIEVRLERMTQIGPAEGFTPLAADLALFRDGWRLLCWNWYPKDDAGAPLLGYADELVRRPLKQDSAHRTFETSSGPVRVEDLAGYVRVPLSMLSDPVLLPALLGTSDSRAPSVEAYLRFAFCGADDKLQDIVASTLCERLEATHARDLRAALFKELDRRFNDRASTSVREMSRALRAVRALVGSAQPDDPLRTRWLGAILRLQETNHDGRTNEAAEAAADLALLRGALVADGQLHLVGRGDRHVAVHHADSFRFGAAVRVMEALLGEPWANLLPLLERGKNWSSLGQYYAMQGRIDEAADAFDASLDDLKRSQTEERERSREESKTRTYRALLATDAAARAGGSLSGECRRRIEDVVGPLGDWLALQPAVRHPYHELLVSRAFFWCEELGHPQAYVSGCAEWSSREEHPWELVDCYRALLLAKCGAKGAVDKHFERAVESTLAAHAGPIVRLIGLAIAKSWVLTRPAAGRSREALETLRATPLSEPMAVVADKIVVAATPREALALLPFNYH